jgi:hypothetical protein
MSSYYNRLGEAGKVPLRADRFFAAQGEWFFSTREGTAMGPFEDKQEAKNGLQDFIEFIDLAEPKTLSRLYEALQPSNAPRHHR